VPLGFRVGDDGTVLDIFVQGLLNINSNCCSFEKSVHEKVKDKEELEVA
jgi:hypothetical protein